MLGERFSCPTSHNLPLIVFEEILPLSGKDLRVLLVNNFPDSTKKMQIFLCKYSEPLA